MMRSSLPLAATCLALLVSTSAQAQEAAAQPGRDPHLVAQSLQNKHIATTAVPTHATDVEWGRAVAIVDAPFADVMHAVTDYGNYDRFLPHFRRSRVLSHRGQNALVYMEVSLLRGTATLYGQVHCFARRPHGPTRIVEGHLLSGNMDHFLARWEVTPLGDGQRTLVAFQLLVDPHLPLPSSFVTHHNVDAARKALIALRKRLQHAPGLADNR